MARSVVIEGVTKAFRRSRAVDGADFTAGHGVTGVLGPNGAGKTTLLRMMATVLAPDSGRLRLLGHDPATASGRLAIRRRLGYLPQEPGFHRGMTVSASSITSRSSRSSPTGGPATTRCAG